MSDYDAFLASKEHRVQPCGRLVDDSEIHPSLFPLQRALVRWSTRLGRSAIFARTGLGKTRDQIEFARLVTKDKALILAPLAVGAQTIREGALIDVPIHDLRSDWKPRRGLNIANHHSLHRIDPAAFDTVVLDESSILKNADGKTRAALIEAFRDTPYRLCCTATPAPNDSEELGNHAEFLGIMSRLEMLATWFVHDEQSWRLKGHAADAFYRWIASWGMFVQTPSDLGFSDEGYILPPLTIEPVLVPMDIATPGMLFFTGLGGVSDRATIRKATVKGRVAACAELVNSSPDDHWLVWCGLNAESEAITAAIPGAVEITGTDSDEVKELAIEWFQGLVCICGENAISAKLQRCQQISSGTTNEPTTPRIASGASPSSASISAHTGPRRRRTSPPTTKRTSTSMAGEPLSSGQPTTRHEGRDIATSRSSEITLNARPGSPQRDTQPRDSDTNSRSTESASPTTITSYASRAADAPYASAKAPATGHTEGSTSIIATGHAKSAASCAQTATPGSVSSETTPSALSARPCTCGHRSGRRVLVGKAAALGFGLNLQHCHRMAFLGLGDSYEQYYQAIRRCHRFGQLSPVDVRIVLADVEIEIVVNVQAKEDEARALASRVVALVKDYEREELSMSTRERDEFEEDCTAGEGWELWRGDCVETMREHMSTDSIDLSVFSPPFSSLFTYSNSSRDIGNCKNLNEFLTHFGFCVEELLRVTKPGRLAAVHVANVVAMLSRDGYIGVKDLRGDVIRLFQTRGWIFHGEVTIDKCPQAQAIRIRAKGLAFQQKERDSSWLRPAMADYIVVFRKPGENAVPILNDDVTRDDWIEWARPIWYGIRETDTLNVAEAREEKDERHVCPLQLGTIERCIRLWSNKGDMVFTPFAGIGSEVYQALKCGRRGLGIELKAAYWNCAVSNVRKAEAAMAERDLFAAQP